MNKFTEPRASLVLVHCARAKKIDAAEKSGISQIIWRRSPVIEIREGCDTVAGVKNKSRIDGGMGDYL